jgi:ABC-type glycerol-3-phosphate transport system substrate-binding protein
MRSRSKYGKVSALVLIVIVVVAAIIIGAVSYYYFSIPTEKITLNIYCRDFHKNAMGNYSAEYMQLNPNVNIQLTDLPFTGLYERLTTSLVGGEEVDMISGPIVWFQNWAISGYIGSIDNYLQSSPVNVTDYKAGGWNGFQYSGKQYGLPWRTGGQILLYNVDAFEEVGLPLRGPETWEEFFDWMTRLTKVDDTGRVVRYGFGAQGKPLSDFVQIGSTIAPYAWSHGSDFITVTGNVSKCNLNSSTWVEAMKFSLKVENYTTPDTLVTAVADLPAKLVSGTMAMGLTDLKAWDGCKSINATTRIGIARFPAGPAGAKCQPVVWAWLFPTAGKHTEEAFKFAHWLQESPERMSKLTPDSSATYSASNTALYQKYQLANYTKYGAIGGGDIAYMDPVNNHPKSAEVINMFAEACSKLWQDPTLDVQATLDAATAEINAKLAS